MGTPGTIIALGGIRLTAYGLITALGILAAYLLSQRQGQLARIRDSALQRAFFGMLIGSLICSRALFVAVQYSFYEVYPQAILKLWEGGYSVFGALAGALIGLRVATGRRGFRRALDTMAPGLALMLGIWRLGELTCYQGRGMIIESGAWGFPFTIKNALGIDCLAVCIYEALIALLIAVYALKACRTRIAGDRGLMCILLLGLGQVPLESMRTDEFLTIRFIKIDHLVAMLLAVWVIVTFLAGHMRAGHSKQLGLTALGVCALMVGLCVNEEFRIDGSPNLALNYTLLFVYVLIMAACGQYLRMGWRASSRTAGQAPAVSRRAPSTAPTYYPRPGEGSARRTPTRPGEGSVRYAPTRPAASSARYAPTRPSEGPARYAPERPAASSAQRTSARPYGRPAASGSAPSYSRKVDAYRSAQGQAARRRSPRTR